ncbi:MAG: FKBP-type peptidyl-prolyl cis-trans isomerase [Bacteroidetes bacterium]|nr:FKBP-type peptidyl-prolyl cis-trans isomerase [Bacteroidota bacterium]
MRFLIFINLLVLSYSCDNESPIVRHNNSKPINKEELKNQFVKANKQVIQKEIDDMNYYQKTHQLNFTTTPSGVRYCVYKPSDKGDSIRSGNQIKMTYTISLLNGNVCYSSAQTGPKTFVIENDNLESGIHKGLQYIKRGDKAYFLIPSHLAHGLLGDFNKIPPQMPILYNVEVY